MDVMFGVSFDSISKLFVTETSINNQGMFSSDG